MHNLCSGFHMKPAHYGVYWAPAGISQHHCSFRLNACPANSSPPPPADNAAAAMLPVRRDHRVLSEIRSNRSAAGKRKQ